MSSHSTSSGLTLSKAEGSSPLIDSHSHPQFVVYEHDREAMIQRMQNANVATIAVGTSYETSKAAIELAKKYPGTVWASVGIHPHHTVTSGHDPMEHEKAIGQEVLDERFYGLAKEKEVIAIGESGLDYHYDKSEETKRLQRESFLLHIDLALKVKKPLIVHARDAYDEIYDILKRYKGMLRGAMHFFQGNIDDAKRFMELGYFISFAGPITFAPMYDEIVKAVPLDMMLLETDAPYAAPAPHRGKRNEPIYVRKVAEKVSRLKNMPLEEVIEATTRNARTLFQI